MAAATDADAIEFKISPEDQDGSGFVSLWNIATTTCDGDTTEARALAAKLLNFLCKKQCDFVVCSTKDAEFLDEKFANENKLLYDWKPESDYVEILAQHAELPAQAFMSFLKTRKFNPNTKYNPRRADRVEWFNDMWSVG